MSWKPWRGCWKNVGTRPARAWMMKPELRIGLKHELRLRVGADQAIQLGAASPSGGAAVFSTPAMINLMEHTARDLVAPYLESGEESVGVSVNVEHLAATPIGTIARATAEITRIDGRMIDFDVQAFDGAEQIGRGVHRRAVIKNEKFASRLREKVAQMPDAITLGVEPNRGALPALETIDVRADGPVVTLMLNRPQQRNAVNAVMTAEWENLVAWLAGHPEVRVAIVTGAGSSFCAGDDVKEVGQLSLDEARALSLRQARLYLAFEQLPQVMIAAVNGPALGAGCVCAYSCDLRIASHAARFGMPEILLGWPPGYGVAQLTAIVGKGRALELCLTGKQISAAEALNYGLVHEIVPQGRLLGRATQVAAQLLALPPQALSATKRLVHADEGLQPKLAHLLDTDAYIRCLATADAKEGIAAFAAKRKPRFTGN